MLDDLRGTVTFEADGSNFESILNTFRESGIICYNIQKTKQTVRFTTYEKYVDDVERICGKNAIAIVSSVRKGAVYSVIKYKHRWGIAFGAVIIAAFIAVMSNIVLRVEIEGNSVTDTDDINAVLSELGVKPGAFIPEINFESIERNLEVTLDNIAWAGIRHSGGRVVVEVDETVKPPVHIASETPCNIFSEKDAVLVKAEVFTGVLTAKVGSGVKKGELLVSGTHVDRYGKSRALHAYGRLVGRYEENASFIQPMTAVENRFTGEEITTKNLFFFELEVPSVFNRKIDGEYELTESRNNFSFLGMELPAGIICRTAKPFSEQEVIYSESEAKTLILQQIERYEKQFLNDCGIVSKRVDLSAEDGCIRADAFYTVEGEIGIQRVFFVNE